MLDTVRMGADVLQVNECYFDKITTVVSMASGEVRRKYITIGETAKTVPRITYYETDKRLNYEVSLPKMLFGDNVHVLSDDSEIVKSLLLAEQYVQDRLHIKINAWSSSRIDYCYVWNVGDKIGSYLRSFGDCPVFQYVRSPYIDENNRQQGFTWRAKSRKVNMYDKGLEAGIDVQGLLRCEIQLLNGQAVQAVKRSANGLDILSCDFAKRQIKSWLMRCGMEKGVIAKDDLLDKLISQYGYDQAASRLLFVETYKRYGCSAKNLMSEPTYRRRRREAVKGGWLISGSETLPELEVE